MNLRREIKHFFRNSVLRAILFVKVFGWVTSEANWNMSKKRIEKFSFVVVANANLYVFKGISILSWGRQNFIEKNPR